MQQKVTALMIDPKSYHLQELGLVNNLLDPRRLVPTFDCAGWVVLDIGCGIGQILTAPELNSCKELHGIDIDEDAIAFGKRKFPDLKLSVSGAERIPYADDFFDLAFSRVALPYTDIPVVLNEIFRVTKPGGRIWLTLHDWNMERVQIGAAIRGANLRRLMDRAYVLVNSFILRFFGRCMRRPWRSGTESFQTESGIKKLVAAAGFQNVALRHDQHFLVTATKPIITTRQPN
jgi:ubiquinone/menaquinone biosynthesis C-methylase UbiE